MANVQFGSTTVEVPDHLLRDPRALADIARRVRFEVDADADTGAPAELRAGLAGLRKADDQIRYLRGKGLDAAQTPAGLAYVDPATKRPVLVDEKGFSARDLIDLAPVAGEMVGSALGAIGGGAIGNVPGAVVGSGAGAVAGREGTAYLLRSLAGADDGRSAGEVAGDVALTGALGAAGEGVGQAVGHGVKALRTALAPSDGALAAKGIADAIEVPTTAGMLGGRVAEGAERAAADSLLGRSAMRAAADGQDAALARAVRPTNPFVAGRQRELDDVGRRLTGEDRLVDEIPDVARAAVREHIREAPQGSLAERLAGARATDRALGERQNVARQFLLELGGGERFSAGQFLKGWERLDPRDKYLLGNAGFGGMRDSLNALLPVARRAEAMQRRVRAPKSTPAGSLFQILGIGGGFAAGGPLGATVAALAPAVTSRLVTSPRFVNWLAKVPTDPGAFSRHLARLGAIAEGEDLRPEIEALVGALRGEPAGE